MPAPRNRSRSASQNPRPEYTLHYKLEGQRRRRVPAASVTAALEHLRAQLPAVVEDVPVVRNRSREVVAILRVK
jgi:hypothetical protein